MIPQMFWLALDIELNSDLWFRDPRSRTIELKAAYLTTMRRLQAGHATSGMSLEEKRLPGGRRTESF